MTWNGETQAKIVVAWDGSVASAETFPLAHTIAVQLGAAVEIVHVIAGGATRDAITAAMADIGLDGLQGSHLRVETGEPATAILAVGDEPAVALMMMTTHGNSNATRRRLGSVAEAALRSAKKPVVLLRPGTSHPARPLKRLLLPMDGTPKTAAALEPATDLARQLGASIDLLFVAGAGRSGPAERGSIGAPRYVDQKQYEWPDWAAEAGARLAHICAHCPPDVPVQMYLAQGDIATEIVGFAAEHACDAIVLVRRSRLQAGRARTLRAVLEQAPCPIVVLSGPET